jgi:hypothetical protein
LRLVTVTDEPIELEKAKRRARRPKDRRPHMPDPPPVRLVAIEDVQVPVPAGLEVQLDDFYIQLLRFERDRHDRSRIIYRAENFRLCFDVLEVPAARGDFRPITLDVPSLSGLQQQLIDREIEFEWQRGLTAGHDTLLLQDPAGNWVQVGEIRLLL